MRRAVIVLALAVAVIAMIPLATRAAGLDRANSPDKTDKSNLFTGMMFVSKDDKGKVTSATLSCTEGGKVKIYNLDMSSISQDLAQFDGAYIQARGELRSVSADDKAEKQGKGIKGLNKTEDDDKAPKKEKPAKAPRKVAMLRLTGKIEIAIPTITGLLILSKDDKGQVTGATITSVINRKTTKVYKVAKDSITQDLSKLDGKEVQCKGAEDVVDGDTILKLKSKIEAVHEAKAKDEKDKDKGKAKDKAKGAK